MEVLHIIAAHADEGQWQPHQLPQLKSELKRIGILAASGFALLIVLSFIVK